MPTCWSRDVYLPVGRLRRPTLPALKRVPRWTGQAPGQGREEAQSTSTVPSKLWFAIVSITVVPKPRRFGRGNGRPTAFGPAHDESSGALS
jgi:hypothetical protein